jgi:hypothetical protein
MSRLTITEARTELATTSLADVQEDTAWTWANRAWVAYESANLAIDPGAKLKLLLRASDCQHEAYEHASLVSPMLLVAVREHLQAWIRLYESVLP